MIYVIIFDFLLCSLTKHNLSLFLLFLPYKTNRIVLIGYFLMLSFFEIKYIFNLILIIVLIYIIDLVLQKFKLSMACYISLCLFSYCFYYGLINLINL